MRTRKKLIVIYLLKCSGTALLVLAMFFANIPVGFFQIALERWADRNVVDALWLAQNSSSIVDTLSPRKAQAAVSTKVGAFNTGTGAVASTVVINDVGFQPKAVIFWWSGTTNSTDGISSGHVIRGFGTASSTTSRWAVGTQSESLQGTSDVDGIHRNDAVIATQTIAGAVDGLLDLQSFDAGGFTLVVDDQFSISQRVHYLALGGTDITNVATGNLQEPGATGNQSITGLGFQPQFVLFGSAATTTTSGVSVDLPLMIGMATGPSNEVVCAYDAEDASALMDTQSYCYGDESIALIGQTTETTNGRATFTQFTADGFDLNWTERASTRTVFYMALRGGSYFVSDDVTSTTEGDTLPTTGMGFSPKAGLMFGGGKAENAADTVSNEDRFVMGAFTGTTERGAQGVLDEHNRANSDTERAVEHDQALFNIQASVTGRVDVQSMDSDGWTLVMDSEDNAASFFGLAGFSHASSKVGAFNTGTAAAGNTVAVTGVGFQPKAVIFWWSGITGTTDAHSITHVIRGLGVASSTTSRWAVASQSEHASASADSDSTYRNDAVIATLTIAAAVDGLMDLQSFDSDGFTLIIDDAFAISHRVHYLALGGTDITNVATGVLTEPGATGSQSITGLGFQPQFVLFGAHGGTTANAVVVDSQLMIGMASGASNEVVCTGQAENASATMDTQSYCYGDESIALIGGTEVTDGRANFTQFTSGGFDINWAERASTRLVPYLALRGGSYFVGDDVTATTNGTTLPISGMGFAPEAGFVFGHGKAENSVDTVSNDDRIVIGAFTGTSERGSQGMLDEHNTPDSDTERAVEHDQVLFNLQPAITGRVDVQSMDSDGWTLVMDSADFVAAFFGFAAFGDNPVVTPPTVTTNFATPGFNQAMLHGTKTGGDNATEHGFAYSTDSALSTGVSTTTLGALNSNSSFSSFVISLSPNTTYFFRAYATNTGGTGYGTIKSFVTGNSTATRNMRLFGNLRLLNGRAILHQQ